MNITALNFQASVAGTFGASCIPLLGVMLVAHCLEAYLQVACLQVACLQVACLQVACLQVACLQVACPQVAYLQVACPQVDFRLGEHQHPGFCLQGMAVAQASFLQ
jgi:hypothetical protein